MKYIKLLRQARANALVARGVLRAQSTSTRDRLQPQRLRNDAIDAAQNWAMDSYQSGRAAVLAHPIRTGLIATAAALWVARRPLTDIAQDMLARWDEASVDEAQPDQLGENPDETISDVMERSGISSDYAHEPNHDGTHDAANEDD